MIDSENWLFQGVVIALASALTLGVAAVLFKGFRLILVNLAKRVFGWRPKPTLGEQHMAALLASGSPRAAWEAGVTTFRDSASLVWGVSRQEFERHGLDRQARRVALDKILDDAPWPDESQENFARDHLSKFVAKMVHNAGEDIFAETGDFNEFDRARSRMVGAIGDWSKLIPRSGFVEWLHGRLGWPYNKPTFKLAWYLAIAVAKESRQQDFNVDCIGTLRDALDNVEIVTPSQ